MASFTNYATVSMAIVITYREVWIDDGGHTHENYRNAVVDKKHDAIFQLRAKFEGLKNER